MSRDEISSIFGSVFDEPDFGEGAFPARYASRRVAFVDLNFSWPPNGGADADLYNVILGLQQQGQEVHLFFLHEAGSSDRGIANPDRLPFPATRLSVAPDTMSGELIADRFREMVDAFEADLVFIQHGFALKPYVTHALAHHVTIGRYYAHELACARDPLRYRDGAPCPMDYLRTPDTCRRCALAHQRPQLTRGELQTWNRDYLAARAYEAQYHQYLIASLHTFDAIVVSNAQMKADLQGFHENVYIFPGGVHAQSVVEEIPAPKPPGAKQVILMTGRVEDPLKGLAVLRDAGEMLRTRRDDFEIWATHFDRTLSDGPFKALGWMNHGEALALYKRADIVVVPSIWEEPFGLVAVEAMAAGLPVCASRVGGLQEIVAHNESGYLHTRGDAKELAQQINTLLDQPRVRRAMGQAGRNAVAQQYTWERIIEQRYLPLIDRMAP